MNENPTPQTDFIVAIIQLGRQQRALALSAEESRLKREASQRNQQHQTLLDALRSIITARLPRALHPYVDWDALCLEDAAASYDEWTSKIEIDIDVPECALITVTLHKHVDDWTWNGSYTILVPDHVEYDYEGGYGVSSGYQIHYDRQAESEVTLALAAAADAYPRLQQLQAECKAFEAGRLDRRHDDEARLGKEADDEENQTAALLRILQADPVLRAFFHAIIAYQNSRASWDAQLSSQYESMQALERRYEESLNEAREPVPPARASAGGPPPPTCKPALSPEAAANVRAQLERRRGK